MVTINIRIRTTSHAIRTVINEITRVIKIDASTIIIVVDIVVAARCRPSQSLENI